jgi:arginine decarboxylase
MNFVPTRVYFAKATYNGRKEDKNSRDRASALIGVDRINICPVTSILPPGVRVISRDEFSASVREGEVVFAVNGVCESNVPGTVVTAGMGMVLPVNPGCGFITELFKNPGVSEEDMQERIEKATLQIMGDQITGGQFSAQELDDLWERGRQSYEIDDVPFRVYRQVASTRVNYQGDYACALVIAVLLP